MAFFESPVGYRFLLDVQVTEDGFAPLGLSIPNAHAAEPGVAAEQQKPEDQPSGDSQGKPRAFWRPNKESQPG